MYCKYKVVLEIYDEDGTHKDYNFYFEDGIQSAMFFTFLREGVIRSSYVLRCLINDKRRGYIQLFKQVELKRTVKQWETVCSNKKHTKNYALELTVHTLGDVDVFTIYTDEPTALYVKSLLESSCFSEYPICCKILLKDVDTKSWSYV